MWKALRGTYAKLQTHEDLIYFQLMGELKMKFCSSCGTQLEDSAAFCGKCGAPQQPGNSGSTSNAPAPIPTPSPTPTPTPTPTSREKYQSYSDVPWYRKNWFAIACFFLFMPALFLVTVSGDVFYEKKGILKKYTKGARVFLIIYSLLATLGAISQMGGSGTKNAVGSDSSTDSVPAAQVVVTTPEELYKAYNANEVAEDNRLKGKIIQFTAPVSSIDKDFTGSVVLHFGLDDSALTSMQAELKDDQAKRAASLSSGQVVTLRCDSVQRVMDTPSADDCVFYDHVSETKKEANGPKSQSMVAASDDDMFTKCMPNFEGSPKLGDAYEGGRYICRQPIENVWNDWYAVLLVSKKSVSVLHQADMLIKNDGTGPEFSGELSINCENGKYFWKNVNSDGSPITSEVDIKKAVPPSVVPAATSLFCSNKGVDSSAYNRSSNNNQENIKTPSTEWVNAKSWSSCEKVPADIKSKINNYANTQRGTLVCNLVAHGDVDGDGHTDTAVVFMLGSPCGPKGAKYSVDPPHCGNLRVQYLIVDMTRSGFTGMELEGRSGDRWIDTMSAGNGYVNISGAKWVNGDPECCASGHFRQKLALK